jgi:hypothetical protein
VKDLTDKAETIDSPVHEIVRCGVKGLPSIGSELEHPVYGRIRIARWLGYAAGESLCDAIRLEPGKPTLIDQLICGI